MLAIRVAFNILRMLSITVTTFALLKILHLRSHSLTLVLSHVRSYPEVFRCKEDFRVALFVFSFSFFLLDSDYFGLLRLDAKS